jgi:hypothetical protein
MPDRVLDVPSPSCPRRLTHCRAFQGKRAAARLSQSGPHVRRVLARFMLNDKRHGMSVELNN